MSKSKLNSGSSRGQSGSCPLPDAVVPDALREADRRCGVGSESDRRARSMERSRRPAGWTTKAFGRFESTIGLRTSLPECR